MLVIIPMINRLMYAFEHLAIRLYLKKLTAEEKVVLNRFVAENRIIDMPLDYPSAQVTRLLKIGIVSPGSGILYPKSEMNPKPYAYFSMPTWIFQYLKAKPGLLEVSEPHQT